MRIGTLVIWIGESVDYGSLGVVSMNDSHQFWVTWADGEVVNYMYGHSHAEKMEVLCK